MTFPTNQPKNAKNISPITRDAENVSPIKRQAENMNLLTLPKEEMLEKKTLLVILNAKMFSKISIVYCLICSTKI